MRHTQISPIFHYYFVRFCDACIDRSRYMKDKKYTGFPALGISWQPMESPHMREAFKMGERKGVLVRIVPGAGASAGLLKKQDVLMSVDGTDVAGDGTVQFREDERIAWSYVVSRKHIGDTIKLRIWRDAKEISVNVTLKPRPTLVPIHLSGLPPSFFITAGLVFVTCSEPYLQDEYGDDFNYDAPVPLLERMIYGHLRNPGEEVVVLSQVRSVFFFAASFCPLKLAFSLLLCSIILLHCISATILLCSSHLQRCSDQSFFFFCRF